MDDNSGSKYSKNEYGMISFEEICSLYDNISIAVWIIDPDRRILYVNNAFVSLLGIPRAWLLNQFMSDNTFKHSVVDIVLKEKRTVSAFQDINNYYKGEKYRQFIRVIPVFDDTGEIKYMIATIEKSDQLYDDLQNSVVLASNDLEGMDAPVVDADGIVAVSQAMRNIMGLTSRIADIDTAVLITGPSGTGKQVIANEIHRKSNRSAKKMVEINCAALPEQLLEAELFGYENGAFTGALKQGKKGLIEEADGGILFLDEINSLPLALQGKLLRALETKTIRRIGSLRETKVDFRLVSATNRSLAEMCENGTFREDLYYRLNIIEIYVPALNERQEDIIPLAENFLKDFNQLYNRNVHLSRNAEAQLLNYSWPGNVRELKNIIERIVVTTDANTEEVMFIPASILDQTDSSKSVYNNDNGEKIIAELAAKTPEIDILDQSLDTYMKHVEKQVLEMMAAKYHTFTDIAKALKIDRTSVMRKFRKYGIELK